MGEKDRYKEIINGDVATYAEAHTSPETEFMHQLNRWTHLHTAQPHMLCGAYQGQLLSMLSSMIQPTTILEIGTFTGYSALCLASGLQEGGTLHTIEANEEFAEIAAKAFKASPYHDRICLHVGDAAKILPSIEPPFDLAYIDADKKSTIDYYESVVPFTRKGGLIIIDNMLWSGKVTQPPLPTDHDTALVQEINDHVQHDERVTNLLLTVRDGLMMCLIK